MEEILARLKSVLLPLPPHEPVVPGLRPSAVLIPIVLHPDEPTMLFTRRADHLRAHAGQVAFPGGGVEPSDADPGGAALRESFEEIGLEPGFVTLLGALPPQQTGTGFYIHPIVGFVRPGFTLAIDRSEVTDVFEVPLAFLLDTRNHEHHRRSFDEGERVYHLIPYDGRMIWGQTAAMLVMLIKRLVDGKPERVPAPSLMRAPWATAPATRRVFAALEAEGTEARFVGGCVRNALLGVGVKDIDIATPEEPQAVMRLLEAAGIRAIPTGLAHGTVTAIAEGARFEITTLRRDVATDGRHATVSFTRDWAEDARRRDFTMNALYAGADGTLYDYVDGRSDLEARCVRFIGDPAQRIAEDYLRILRFFRFHAWYGKGALDAAGLAACAAAKDGLARLSGERVAQELSRILEARDPVAVLTAMKETGILAAILPEAEHLDWLARLGTISLVFGRPVDWVLRLCAVVGRNENKLAAVACRLKLSNDIRTRLERLATSRIAVNADLSPEAQRAALYRAGPLLFRDLALLQWAEGQGDEHLPLRAVFIKSFSWTPPVFPLTGADVIAAGVPEGPEVGRILARIEEGWIAEDFQADRETLLKRI